MSKINAIVGSGEDLKDFYYESSSGIVTTLADNLKYGNEFFPGDVVEVQNPIIIKKILKVSKENLLSNEKKRQTTIID